MLTAERIEEYRAERLGRLERRCEYLEGERRRLECLLADALKVAVAGTQVSPWALLDVLASLRGTNLARAAFVEHREQAASAARIARLVDVLRKTAPERRAAT